MRNKSHPVLCFLLKWTIPYTEEVCTVVFTKLIVMARCKCCIAEVFTDKDNF